MGVSGKAANATKRKNSIIRLEIKDASRQVSTRIEMKSQTAILHIRAELERNDCEALRDIAPCRAVSHNCLA